MRGVSASHLWEGFRAWALGTRLLACGCFPMVCEKLVGHIDMPLRLHDHRRRTARSIATSRALPGPHAVAEGLATGEDRSPERLRNMICNSSQYYITIYISIYIYIYIHIYIYTYICLYFLYVLFLQTMTALHSFFMATGTSGLGCRLESWGCVSPHSLARFSVVSILSPTASFLRTTLGRSNARHEGPSLYDKSMIISRSW